MLTLLLFGLHSALIIVLGCLNFLVGFQIFQWCVQFLIIIDSYYRDPW